MRKQDKKINMERVNKLFQQRINEEKFSWNGEYANELDEDSSKETADEKTQWFSDVDGELFTDKIEP